MTRDRGQPSDARRTGGFEQVDNQPNPVSLNG